jgi:hypothetical protein
VSLNTKSAAKANILFLQADVALEQEFEEIRVRIKAPGEPLPSQRDRAGDMTAAYFQGPERGAAGLDGMERLIARLKIDRGLWNMTPTGCSPVAEADLERWWACKQRRDVPRPWRYASATAGAYARIDMRME